MGALDAQVKGYSLLSYVTPLQREHPALWARIEGELDEPSRRFYAEPIYANTWYSRQHMHRLMRAFEIAVHGDRTKLRELGRMAAHYQVNLIYRMFLKFATPAMVFKRASSLWSRQSTVGAFSVVTEGSHHLVGELQDPDLPMGLPDVMAGWSDAIIEMFRFTPEPTTWERVASDRWRFFVRWKV
ncbi:MAG: hypothetical protein KF901_11575 [Myxococcales bacterium]|nr:hypothetical protein [Myxococcales bacterium]